MLLKVFCETKTSQKHKLRKLNEIKLIEYNISMHKIVEALNVPTHEHVDHIESINNA